MTGRHDRKPGDRGAKPSVARVARNAQSKAHMNLAKALASVFTAGVYTKEELQTAVWDSSTR